MNIKKVLSKIGIYAISSAVLMSSASAYAMQAEQKIGTDIINVSGEDESSKYLTIKIVEESYPLPTSDKDELDDFLTSKVVYLDQVLINSERKFNFSVAMGDNVSGLYKFILTDEKGNESIDYFLPYSSISGTEVARAKIYSNNKEILLDFDKFKDFANRKPYKYDLLRVPKDDSDSEETLKILHDYLIDEKTGEIENGGDITVAFKKAEIISELNKGKITSIADVLKEEYIKDSTLKTEFLAFSMTEKAKEEYTRRLKEKNINSINDFDKELVSEWILSNINYPDGYGNVVDIFKLYDDKLEISSDDMKYIEETGRALSGKNFISIDSLIKSIDEEIKNFSAKKLDSSGGSGSGGGGGFVSSAKDTEEKTTTIPIPIYYDVADDYYAKDAITYLSEKLILNGKGDFLFCPEDLVTREEFVKMLVAAFFIDAEEKPVSFFDVVENEWYTPYIKKVSSVGLVNGISENLFGVGDVMIRQDLAVLIYRTAKKLDYKLVEDNHQKKFDDDGEISDYAKEAVGSLYMNDIVHGVSETQFQPYGYVTRGQAAMIIYNLIKY
jgi:hypothetical protein